MVARALPLYNPPPSTSATIHPMKSPLLGIIPLLLAACASTPTPAPAPAPPPIADKITTFLMFEGQAEEAMNFYLSLFPDSRILRTQRYGPGEAGPEGALMLAVFELGGRQFTCFNSPAPHPFTFTPAISLFITCKDEAEIDRLFAALTRDGSILMPLDAYPFAAKYAWVSDRFGVSWQLSLPNVRP